MPPPTPNSEEPLNAPFGARCFLAQSPKPTNFGGTMSLNAPFGARCFLAPDRADHYHKLQSEVLMHLLALGAFWLSNECSCIGPA